MMRLPLTVIGGYLGAGKTTLINRLLAEDHGLRLLVLVNDFGAINVDEALIAEAGTDTLALTNGCVCCSMSGDLFMAIGDVLARAGGPDAPDHIVIEASGVADPGSIANVARAEPMLSYGGIVTLLDGLNGAAVLSDPLIAVQVAQQIRVADLLVLTKTETLSPDLTAALHAQDLPNPLGLGPDTPVAPLLFGITPLPGQIRAPGHPAYTRWHCADPAPMTRDALRARLATRPDGIYRVKGFVPAPDGMWEVQAVGSEVDIRPSGSSTPGLVGLGLAARVSAADFERWWPG
ncbi:MAG: GTP-binding protein [Marinibacterium sp.]|nr:GTP-binding protein [Marinibacterium sp.]